MRLLTMLNALLLLSPYARSAEAHFRARSSDQFDPLSAADLSKTAPRAPLPLSSHSPSIPAAPLPFKGSELTGNLTLTITIDEFKEIFTEELQLTDGEHPVIKHNITRPTLRLTEIPIGTYTLTLPTGKESKYAINAHSVLIKPSDNELLINYRPKPPASLLTQSFTFLGDKDKPFAILTLDFENEQLILNVMEQNPNPSFEDKKRIAAFTLLGNTTAIIFSNEIPATQAITGIYQAKFNYGDSLSVCLEEHNRLETNDHLLLTPKLCNVFSIKQFGLVNREDLPSDYKNFKSYVDQAAQAVRERPQWKKMKYNPFKDNIYLALTLLEAIGYNRTELLKEYQDVIPVDNQPPGEWVGNQFSINLEGIYDLTFLTTTVDRVEKTITFTSQKGQPHLYFQDTYALVRYRDPSGEIRYQHDFIGNETLQPTKVVLPLSDQGGELLSIYHHEGRRRCLFTNQMQNKTMPCDHEPGAAVNVTYQLTNTASTPIKPTPITTSTSTTTAPPAPATPTATATATTASPVTATTGPPSTPSTTPTPLITSMTALSSSALTSAASLPTLPCAGWLGVLGGALISSS